MTTPRPRWPTQTRLVVSLLVLALFIYLLFRFSVVVPPLILAFILAYILSPIVNRLQERLHIKRGLATALSYLIIVLIAAIVPLSIAPLLAPQYADLNFDIQLILGQVEALLGQQFTFMGIAIDGGVLVDQISNSFRLLAEPFIGQTLYFLVDVITSTRKYRVCPMNGSANKRKELEIWSTNTPPSMAIPMKVNCWPSRASTCPRMSWISKLRSAY